MASGKTNNKSNNITKYNKKSTANKKTDTSKKQAASRNRKNESVTEERRGLSLAAAVTLGLLIAFVLELSNFNVFGQFGGWIKYAQFGLFGSMAFVFPIMILLLLIVSTFKEKKNRITIAGIICFLLLCAFSHLVSSISLNNHNVLTYFTTCAESLSGGGIIGGAIALALYLMLSQTGAVIITVLVILVCLFFIFEEQIKSLFDYIFAPSDDEFEDEYDDYEDEPYIEEVPKRKKVEKYRKTSYQEEEYVPRRNSVYREEEYEPRRNPVKKKSSRYYDEPVYETVDDYGRVIRIVKAKKRKGRVNTAPMTRVVKKAQPMRDGSVEVTRAGNKVRGISRELEMIPGNAGGDEIHEITRRRNKNAGTDTSYNKNAVDYKYEQLAFKEEELMKQPEAVNDIPEENDAYDSPGVFNRPEAVITSVSQAAVNRRAKEARPVKVRKEQIQEIRSDSENNTAASNAPINRPMSQIAAPAGTYKSNSVPAASSAAEVKSNSYDQRDRTAAKPQTRAVAANIRLTNDREGDFYSPPIDMLAYAKSSNATSEAELEKIARDLEVILNQFGVHVTVTDIQAGPSVTRFELQPELGTRVNKITSLADDLKLNLGVTEIRIEAPIPGRQAVGIEIPNKNRQTVYMRELLEESALINHPSKIAFAAGKDISGNVIVADIAKMPHLLVAGTTGSGKSVFLNSILMTILYRAKPSEVGLIIIDPKKVEFGVYAGIPHLMREVVTDPGQAVSTLRWAVNEMTNRYQRMQMSSVRDFKSYNAKVEKGTVNPDEENPRKMNQIVIIIDELADLMMVAKKEAEALICRLAQLARAAGIHLIIATQRPSVDVVTGLIKANVPARVALLVSSQIDSRTIIDMQGAEKLLGNGDMLFYPTGYVKPVRIQGAFVSDDEIQQTVDYLIDNNTTDYFAAESKEIEKFMNSSSGEGTDSASSSESDSSSKYDDCFYEAGKMCIEMGKASSSMLQRRFNLGFNRAARIIDQLQEFGVVGPQNGAKPRQILVDQMTFEEMYQNMSENK